MKSFLIVGPTFLLVGAVCMATAESSKAWLGYGGNPQHDAVSATTSSKLTKVVWSTALDDARSYYGDAIFMHYASPCVTTSNTLVHSYRFSKTNGESTSRDNWRVLARSGKDGKAVWQLDTDYSAPLVYPSDWTSVYPLALSSSDVVAAAGGGATVLFRKSANSKTGKLVRQSFYAKIAKYETDPASFSGLRICTPLTSDGKGTVYFGYLVQGNVPSTLASKVGTGGVAKIDADGKTVFTTISGLKVDNSLTRPAINAAPTLSNDGKSVYLAVCNDATNNAYLVKLDAKTFALKASVHLEDPSDGQGARVINEASSSPMVGPDGHVFMGVFGYQWRESHGWMLQFDADLKAKDAMGKRWPIGAFGWDDTPSVVTSKLVPSYKGKSKYLILSKYNNYVAGTGDGQNQLAVLDPSKDDVSKDRQTGIAVMNEVLTVLGPTPDPEHLDENHPKAVREWCINSAAIDPNTKSAIVNSEDGYVYRWSFVTNKLTEALRLQPATGEAYTSTVIGPDGTCYAINNSILHAIRAK